jgi:hypothetical protein
MAIVDDDRNDLAQFHWYICSGRPYARRSYRLRGKGKTTVFMHREVARMPHSWDRKHLVDHINHNTLDNRACNLRVVTYSENNHNASVRKDNKSGYRGVTWDNKSNKWRASIRVDGTNHHIGFFANKHDAIMAREAAAARLVPTIYGDAR